MDQQDLGHRIAEARTAHGWSQSQLAQTLGMDRTTLAKIEQGHRKVTALELADLSHELGRRIEWFLTPPPVAIAQHRRGDSDPSTLQPIDVELESLADDVLLLDKLGRLEAANRPHVLERPTTTDEAEHLGLCIRQAARLQDAPARDLIKACETLGLLVFSREFGDQEADGASLVIGSRGVALVNSSHAVGRRRLATAHELVHFMIDDQYISDFRIDADDDAHESRIDRAARSFLMPGNVARSAWSGAIEHGVREAAIRLGSHFEVDMSTLARRLQELGCVDAETARSIRNVRTRKSDIVELGLYVPHDLESTYLSPAYSQAVVRSYEAESITVERAMALMRGTFAADDFAPRQVLPPDSLLSVLK